MPFPATARGWEPITIIHYLPDDAIVTRSVFWLRELALSGLIKPVATFSLRV